VIKIIVEMVKILIPLTFLILLTSMFFFLLRIIVDEPNSFGQTFAIFIISGFDNALEIEDEKFFN